MSNKGQALIELVVGFGIIAIVLSAVTLLLISSRESKYKAANILAAETSAVFQSEAMRSVREDGWNNLTNGTYHLTHGPEYKVIVCYQTGCSQEILDEATGSSNGSGEVMVYFNFDQPQPLPGLRIHVEKITDCDPLCPEDSIIKTLTLKDLEINKPERILICQPAGCGPGQLIEEVAGKTNNAGEVAVNFSYTTPQAEVAIFVAKPEETDGCAGFGCLQWPTIKKITVGDFDPGTSWHLVPGSEKVAGFTRQINIEDTCREGGNIVNCPSGTVDPSTKKLTSSVTWSSFFGGKVENVSYLTRHLNNTTWTQTTKAEFDNGTFVDTETKDDSGGEVQLGPGYDWSKPKLVTNQYYNNPGNADATDIFNKGNFSYLTTEDGGSNPNLSIIEVIPDPFSLQSRGTINLGTTVNAVSVEDDDTEGHFAYLATTSDAEELMVVDVANKNSPTKVTDASLNLGDGADALDIFLSGSGNKKFTYIAKQSSNNSKELYIVSVNTCFDVTGEGAVNIFDYLDVLDHYGETGESIYDLNGDNSVTILDLIIIPERFFSTCPHAPVPRDIGDFEVGNGPARENAANGIFADGNTVYLATSKNDEEFIIIDASTINNPVKVDSFDTPSNASANDVYISKEKAYLVTQNNPTGSEYYFFDVSDPSTLCSPTSECGDLDIGGDVNAVWASASKSFLATGIDDNQFIVIDSSISQIGSEGLRNGTSEAFGIFTLGGEYAFLANDHNQRELQIVKAGSGSRYVLEGTFESPIFTTGSNVGFNFLTWMAQEQAPSSIQFQIATNDNGSTWNFVGPDGTDASYYETPGAIPLNSVSGTYFRYKAYLSGNGGRTPILEDVTVNYSP